MGDTATSGHGGKLRDDFTPQMAKISYALRAVMRECRADGTIATLAEKTRKLRVKPVFERRRTLISGCENSDYRLKSEKTMRKRGLGEALGKLTMEAQRPYCLHLEDTRSPTYNPLSAHARALLRFDPAKTGSPPPEIGSLKSELKVITFFATTPRTQFPCREQAQRDASVDFSSITLPLASRAVNSALWTKQESQETSGGAPFYTADLQVPIELPTSKTFIPTFHSCLVSRVYRLDLSISTSAMNSLTIKVPLWILSEGSGEYVPESAQQDLPPAMEWLQDASPPRNLTPPPEY